METNDVFATTYAKQLPIMSRDEAYKELNFIHADRVLSLVKTDAKYHNLKVLARSEFANQSIDDLLISYAFETSEDELSEAIEIYHKTKNARDIDEYFDKKLNKEVAKLDLDENIKAAWKAENEDNQAALIRFIEKANQEYFGDSPIYAWWLKCRK